MFCVEPAQGCRFDYLEVSSAEDSERYCGRVSQNFGDDLTGVLVRQGSLQVYAHPKIG